MDARIGVGMDVEQALYGTDYEKGWRGEGKIASLDDKDVKAWLDENVDAKDDEVFVDTYIKGDAKSGSGVYLYIHDDELGWLKESKATR